MTDTEAVNSEDVEIPEFTLTSLTQSKIKAINIKKYSAKRVAKLFISDILDTDKVKKCENGNRQFSMGDITFRSIYVHGTVVGIQNLTLKTKERVLISVDDGTGVLDCYAEENLLLTDKKEAVDLSLKTAEDVYSVEPSNTLRASLMMLRSAQDKINKMPNHKHFNLGDSVKFIGNITEYNGKRTCFISSIIRDTSGDNIPYLENLLHLYETMYIK